MPIPDPEANITDQEIEIFDPEVDIVQATICHNAIRLEKMNQRYESLERTIDESFGRIRRQLHRMNNSNYSIPSCRCKNMQSDDSDPNTAIHWIWANSLDNPPATIGEFLASDQIDKLAVRYFFRPGPNAAKEVLRFHGFNSYQR